jgi:hypothetical protein
MHPKNGQLGQQTVNSIPPSRRNGKVARLPHATRQVINQMLDDGIMYKDIIARLGDAGADLTVHNLSNWRMGGYQDYLNEQREETATRIRTEAAVELAKSNTLPATDEIGRTINQLSLLQQLELVAEKGDQYAAEAFRKNPAKFITLMNACTKLSNTSVAMERLKLRAEDARQHGSASACEPAASTSIQGENPQN